MGWKEAQMCLKWVMAAAVGLACVFASAQPASAAEVRVTLTGVEPRGGKILVSLQTEAQFMQGQGAYGQVIDPPGASGPVTIVFPDVAPGDYALMVMHDEDSNYQMRMSATGAPQEGWAISHADRLTGPPNFATNRFTVGAAPVSLTEPIIYPYVPPGQ